MLMGRELDGFVPIILTLIMEALKRYLLTQHRHR
jgi:hypothetical protein